MHVASLPTHTACCVLCSPRLSSRDFAFWQLKWSLTVVITSHLERCLWLHNLDKCYFQIWFVMIIVAGSSQVRLSDWHKHSVIKQFDSEHFGLFCLWRKDEIYFVHDPCCTGIDLIFSLTYWVWRAGFRKAVYNTGFLCELFGFRRMRRPVTNDVFISVDVAVRQWVLPAPHRATISTIKQFIA